MKIDIDRLSLEQLPTTENDFFEYKSSKLWGSLDSLKDKIGKAVSGFANSGGGYFIVGVDDKTGNADGGIPLLNKRQPIRDWVDTMIHQLVEPTPNYSIKLFEDAGDRGFINTGCGVLVIAINESHNGPHMMNGSYFIRAGVHTVPAKHFIVEAIRANRFNAKPKLSHTFRLKPGYEQVLQLGIVAITNALAVNVTISLSPLPEKLKYRAQDFPICLPFIDQNNPFFFDVSIFSESGKSFGDDVKLLVEYDDIFQNHYKQELQISLKATPPVVIGNKHKELIRALKDIEKALHNLSQSKPS